MENRKTATASTSGMLTAMALMLCAPAYAADDTQMADARTVPMISGGVGDSEESALSQEQGQYNLKLLFTEANGMYLSDVQVHISGREGQQVADTVTNGPILLAKLPPGKYEVTAVSEGESKAQKVSVGGTLRTYQFRYTTRDTEN